MKKKKVLSAAMALTTLLGSSSILTGCGQDDPNSSGVRAFKLEKQDLTFSVSASGNIDGVRLDIENSQHTKAIKVNVKEGDYVTEGDVLFEFDSTELEEQYKKLSSQYEIEDDKIKHEQSVNADKLNSTKKEKSAMLQQAKRKVDDATSTYYDAVNKRDSLSTESGNLFDERNSLIEQHNEQSSQSERERINEAIQEADKRLAEIDAELKQLNSNIPLLESAMKDAKDYYSNTERQYNELISNAENAIETDKFVTNSIEKDEIKELKKKMENCVITAPVSGVVVSPSVIEGAIPGSGILATIVDTSDLSVNVSVSEYDIPNIAENMEVIIKTSATGTEEIKGKVKKISHMNTNSEAGISYPVEIDIDENTLSEDLYIGMTARTEIISEKKTDVFAVPYDIFIMDSSDYYIMAAIPDGDDYIAKKIPVEVNEATSYLVEINSDEIEEGMLIISETSGVKEGKKVKVNVEE